MPLRPILQILLIGTLLPLLDLAQTTSPKQPTVWDGIFTQADADRGAAVYSSHCSQCHGQDLGGYGGVLVGSRFMDHWREDSLSNLLKKITDTMPPGPRGQVSDAEYRDIVAYVLRRNDFPAGARSLATAELQRILIVGKEGPAPVPDFALVTVVGCLAQDGAHGWMVTNSNEPLRTRNPKESTGAELAGAVAREGGNYTFHFMDSQQFPSELNPGRWTEAKGFLIRSPGNDRINLTWLKALRETCGNHKY